MTRELTPSKGVTMRNDFSLCVTSEYLTHLHAHGRAYDDVQCTHATRLVRIGSARADAASNHVPHMRRMHTCVGRCGCSHTMQGRGPQLALSAPTCVP